MDNLAIALIIIAELAALVLWGRRRSGWSALTVFGAYLIGAQLMAWLVMHEIVTHEMLDLYGGPDRTSELFHAIAAAAVLFVVVRLLDSWNHRVRGQATSANSTAPTVLASICAGAWAMLFLCVVATLDWARLWSTSSYLDLTDPDVMTRGPLSGLAFGALPLAGALSAAMFSAMLGSARKHRNRVSLLAALLALQAGLTMIWLLSAHSRAAALPPAAFAFIILIASDRDWRTRLRLVISGLLVVIALAGALAGRNAGDHGLASLAGLPGQIAMTDDWAPRLAGNLTEGIFAVAAGLGEWRASPAGANPFPSSYIWLSFSPLPSAIDGFSDILDAQMRLHAYAPMPGYVELAWFGPWAQLAFAGLVLVSFRMATLATGAAPATGAFALLLLTACLYLMAAYPVRTSLKLLWPGLAASLAISLAAPRRQVVFMAGARSPGRALLPVRFPRPANPGPHAVKIPHHLRRASPDTLAPLHLRKGAL